MTKKAKKESSVAVKENKAGQEIDVVRLTGDALTEVNMTLSGLLQTDEGYHELEQKRDELEARLKRLVREFIGRTTDRFISANDSLVQVNNRMKADLQSLENMQRAIEAVTGLINALDGFISAVFPAPQA